MKKIKKKKTRSKKKSARPRFAVSELRVTDEPINSPEIKNLPASVKDRLDELCDLARKSPQKAIPELETLCQQYPDVPHISNYLAGAYSRIFDVKKKNRLVVENYAKYPNYLFAKVHYCELCLDREEFDKIPEIFNHKFDLNQLYPERKVFHITEATVFMGTIGYYLACINQTESAALYYSVLSQMAPGHRVTKRLKRKLYPSVVTRIFRYLFSQKTKDQSKGIL